MPRVNVLSHPCFFVCAESSFDEISRRNSWPANTMTAVPKGMNAKNEDDMKPVIMMDFSCMNNYWFCTEIDSWPHLRIKQLHTNYFLSFVGPPMEHQHNTRVSEPAQRIVQGMKASRTTYFHIDNAWTFKQIGHYKLEMILQSSGALSGIAVKIPMFPKTGSIIKEICKAKSLKPC